MKNTILKLSLSALVVGVPMAYSNEQVAGTEPSSNDQDPRGTSAEVTPNTPLVEEQARGTPADLKISRDIRSHLASDNQLSQGAKNVNINTNNGYVTLSGTVETQKQKDIVAKHARMVVSNNKLKNNIKVSSSGSAR